MKKNLLFIVTVLLSATAQAQTVQYTVSSTSSVDYILPYTLGKHTGASTEVSGSIQMDPKTGEVTSATIGFPLASLRSDDPKRDCHMIESLGLNYKTSQFPEKHVCDRQNKLPSSGPDAVAFPDIEFTIEKKQNLKEGTNTIQGLWNIHGVQKPTEVKVVANKSADNGREWIIEGEQDLRLSDFDLIVKPFFVIKVKDTVRIRFKIVFSQNS